MLMSASPSMTMMLVPGTPKTGSTTKTSFLPAAAASCTVSIGVVCVSSILVVSSALGS